MRNAPDVISRTGLPDAGRSPSRRKQAIFSPKNSRGGRKDKLTSSAAIVTVWFVTMTGRMVA